MKSFGFGTYALSGGVAVALLAGCGSQPLVGAPGAMPQTSAIATHADLGKLWMLPRAKSEDLIYATGGCGGACIFSYPDGNMIGTVNISGSVQGACSDTQGNVFITNDANVLEFAHGGTSPIATLSLPGSNATGCSVDSKTGDLAVAFSGSTSEMAIFTQASGTPATYDTHLLTIYCGYDNYGNLFASGYGNGDAPGISELAMGSPGFSVLSINGQLGDPGQMQWDGKYMTYEGITAKDIAISRLRISGSVASIVSTRRFHAITGYAYQSWINDNRILIPYGEHGRAKFVGLWKYPNGGPPLNRIRHLGKLAAIWGVTVSVASSR
jgi:hypothetical protein